MILYKTIMKEGTASHTIEKSKFICSIKPVDTRQEAEEFIKAIKKKYKDATHNVPCMVIGDKLQLQWASDDGEPQGTAGSPMLQMIVSQGITNLALVATRYFGGIKLGTGGLVRAYTNTAKLGLEAAGIGQMKELILCSYEFDYNFLNTVKYMVEKNEKYMIEDMKYEDKVTVFFLTESENAEELCEEMAKNTHGGAVKKSEELVKKYLT